MLTNRPLYVMKFNSSRLKKFDYNINNTFKDLYELDEIIPLTDSQMLRTIRNITKRIVDKEKLEKYIIARKLSKKYIRKKNKKLRKIGIELYNKYNNKIYNMCFNEDYVVVIMDRDSHYDHLFNYGFKVNGKTYKRVSCSAGQARVSTVVFCNEEIIDEVELRLNNGRDMDKKMSPSKFNAYFGLYSSATKVVSEPKFIVVKDYFNKATFDVNFVSENSWNHDDSVHVKTITEDMNRTDGMGLISPKQAKKWGEDLGLDYIPSCFCIRQSYSKGLLVTFDIHEFCKEKNNGNYIVDTIYKDDNGEYIKADLRDYDVIVSESQFKLWDSYNSVDDYIVNCRKNKLDWGVSIYTPKEPKHMLKLNYQFIQTLDLNRDNVEELCNQFVEWINGVSYNDRWYMLLFLLGVNNTKEKIEDFMKNSDSYWIKSLMLCEDLKHDKFIKSKIRELVKKRISDACKGDIYVNGNFQQMISDPYGFMEHVCGLEVNGIVKKDMVYSKFWNNRNVKEVDLMRSPLTYFSEHVVRKLQSDEEINRWFKYLDVGIVYSYHGNECVNHAGADYDNDIVSSTDNRIMINGVMKNELPVSYNPPKPSKINFTKQDLYLSDKFSFGSIIGQITNKSTSGICLLSTIKEKYGIDSQEYRLLKSRLQQCCASQSKQIDKAKLGRAVKGIPKVWTKKNKIKENDKHKKRKELYNATLLDKHPYFFRYVYEDTNRKYKKYYQEEDITCMQFFGITLKELQSKDRLTKEESEFLKRFDRYCPVIINNSTMNMVCNHIESINFSINQKVKTIGNVDVFNIYKVKDCEYEQYYNSVVKCLKEHLRQIEQYRRNNNSKAIMHDGSMDLIEKLLEVNDDMNVIINCLVDFYYIKNPSKDKSFLWKNFGTFLYSNVLENVEDKRIMFPFPKEDGDIEYLGYKYELGEVNIEI